MLTLPQSDFDPLRDVQAGGGPGMRSFIYGHLAPEAFPITDLIAACEQALREGGTLALQYGPAQGYGPLIDYLRVKIQRDEGLSLSRDHLTRRGTKPEPRSPHHHRRVRRRPRRHRPTVH